MKKLIAVAIVVSAVFGGFATDDTTAWQMIYWQVEDQSSRISAYDNAKLYARLGSGDSILLYSSSSDNYVAPGEDSEIMGSPNLLTTLGSDLSGYSFWAELYYNSVAVGSTEVFSYQSMLAANAFSSYAGGSAIPEYNTWLPTFAAAVPEPTSGLLMLLGAAGLALRRRRQLA